MNMQSGWATNIPDPKIEADIRQREAGLHAEIQLIKNFCNKHGMSIIDDMPGVKNGVTFFMDDTRVNDNEMDFGQILEEVYDLVSGFEGSINIIPQTAHPEDFSLDSHIDKFVLQRIR